VAGILGGDSEMSLTQTITNKAFYARLSELRTYAAQLQNAVEDLCQFVKYREAEASTERKTYRRQYMLQWYAKQKTINQPQEQHEKTKNKND
jgi:hypothetical protein